MRKHEIRTSHWDANPRTPLQRGPRPATCTRLRKKRRISRCRVKNLDPIIEHLERIHAHYNAVAQSVPDERWRESPGAGAWSAGEVTAHVMMAENVMAGGID